MEQGVWIWLALAIVMGTGGEGGVLVQSVPFARRVDGDIRRIRLISKPISQLEF